MDKDKFVRAIEKSRELVNSGRYDTCPCSQKRCEWHGKCFECVMIHRVKKKHIPECMQPLCRDIIADLAKKVEFNVIDERPTKEDYDYLYKVSPQKNEKREKRTRKH